MKKAKKKNKKINGTRNIVANTLKVLGLFLPLACYLIAILWIWPVPNSGFIVMGFAGAFLVGIGLMTLGGLVNGMYISKWLTIIFVSLGGMLIGVSSVILYVPIIYSQIDEMLVTFYFMILLCLSVLGIWYYFFRGAVSISLRENGISKTHIEKSMKGMRNYWWYEEIHREIDIKNIFFVNKVFTIIFPATIAMHLFLGWLKFMSPIIAFMLCVVCPLSFVMSIFTVQYLKKHKRLTVFEHIYRSILFTVFPLLIMAGVVIYTLNMWNIQ